MSKISAYFKAHWKQLFAVLGVLACIVLVARWWLGPQVLTEPVVRRDFVQSVVASGHVETPHRVDVGAQITGTVVRVPVIEGQNVKAGDVLVALEPSELLAAERQAGLAVGQARARLRQVREVQAPVAEQAVRQAQANLDNAASILKRNEDLARRGFISAAALEEFQKAVALAEAQLSTMQRQFATARPAGSDSALAEVTVAEAQASAEVAGARARYAVIRAAVDGTLISRNVEVGDVVQAGKVLMTLSPNGRTQLIVDIDEKNLRLLALGQKAVVSADAYPQHRFAAEVAYINPGVNVLTGAVQVKLDVPLTPAELRQDMTVSVDIEVARRPQALLVPTSVVHDADSAAPWVMTLLDGKTQHVPVRLGLSSGGYSEITEGLHEGDALVPVSVVIGAGTRARR